jgi:uncharacterized protein YbcC (UPF0753/DUF2309 family)
MSTAIDVEPKSRAQDETIDTDRRAAFDLAIAGACRRIAPLWPLKHFVAVNPFLGFSHQSFHATCAMLRRVARIDMLLPRAFYREMLATGIITRDDISFVLNASPKEWHAPDTVEALIEAIGRDVGQQTKHPAVVATVAEVLDSLAAGDRQVSRTSFMTDEISKWCAAYFDEGQSVWRLPSRSLRPYPAWRAAVKHDLNPEVMGISRFRAIVAELPEDPTEAIIVVIDRIGVPARAIEDYLHRALLDQGGWAAYARYIVWGKELYNESDDSLLHLLAIRIVWGYALFAQRKDKAFKDAWSRAMHDSGLPPEDETLGDDPELCADLIMQEAYEASFQRRLLAKLQRPDAAASTGEQAVRKTLQAAFCIDVRSEVYRRALETVRPDAETIGFAGFFGFPIEYVPIGHVSGGAQCPVLLTPKYVVCEAVDRATPGEEAEILSLRLMRRRVAKAWKSFKSSAVSSFIYVETLGILFGAKILSDSLGFTRTVHDPNTDGLDESVIARLAPRIEPQIVGGRNTGFDEEDGLNQAEAVLRGMSMTADFARIVMLAGHGSTTVNNPQATGLDCGACGGHTGEANARVAAAILNHYAIRGGLRRRGIDIPGDTWFIGCLHDTTTDEVRFFDADKVPQTHAEELAELRRSLVLASSLARLERAALLGVAVGPDLDKKIVGRSYDWSQVRPEWGLAGNAAFIAAPRSRTRGVDLGGRAFLHDYEWRSDVGFSVLELIMTAPLIVATWINLQYYGSTVNNQIFGSGNKVLHNVTGMIGVLEGNAGDLKVGLPWQSVHDGRRFVHEPLRLNVFVEAPMEAINSVIDNHEAVRQLVDNRWLHLFLFDEAGKVSHRYVRDGKWSALT